MGEKKRGDMNVIDRPEHEFHELGDVDRRMSRRVLPRHVDGPGSDDDVPESLAGYKVTTN